MVVCQVVRIRNETRHTYHVQNAGELFYNPQVGGQAASGSSSIAIPPAFDQACKDFVVPWRATTWSGMVFWQEDCPDVQVRVAVGPCQIDNEATDWLRLHDACWEPVALDYWLPLGGRHLLGAIGSTVNVVLTFRDKENSPSLRTTDARGFENVACDKAQRLGQCIIFERESACSAANTVFLNVYDLASVASIPNSILCNSIMKTFGAYHVAIEVYGEEWGFFRQDDPDECGICRSRVPRRHPVHVYRQSVNLGCTPFVDFEIWNLLRRELIPAWSGGRYDLIHCNCIHFADEFAKLLKVEPVPPWVKGLHEAGATAASWLPWAGARAASLIQWWPATQLTGTGSAAGPVEETVGVSGTIDGTATPSGFRTPSAALATADVVEPDGRAEQLRPSFLPAPLEEVDEGGAGPFRRPLRGDSSDSFTSVIESPSQVPQIHQRRESPSR